MKVWKKTKVPKAVILVNNGKKYLGKYVAVANFYSQKVIASGKDPLKVRERAIKKGFKDPVIYFILEGKRTFWSQKEIATYNQVINKLTADYNQAANKISSKTNSVRY